MKATVRKLVTRPRPSAEAGGGAALHGVGTLSSIGPVDAPPDPMPTGTPDEAGVLRTPSGASAEMRGEVLALRSANGAVVASFDATTGELRLEAPRDLVLAAPHGRVRIAGREVELTADRLRQEIGHIEIAAGRIVERSRELYRSVETLLETRARRARTIVETTLELLSGRTSVVSKEDTRIDGKRVLLG